MVRMLEARSLAAVVVAIPRTPDNRPLLDLCRSHNWNYYLGPENDVLRRYALAAHRFKADPVIRMTMDCPLIDPLVIDAVVSCYAEGSYDYVSNNFRHGLPHGLDVECFSRKVLRESDKRALLPFEREHVTEFIRTRQDHPYRLGSLTFRPPATYAWVSDVRLTVDFPLDLALVRKIYGALGDSFDTNAVFDLLADHPEWREINKV